MAVSDTPHSTPKGETTPRTVFESSTAHIWIMFTPSTCQQ